VERSLAHFRALVKNDNYVLHADAEKALPDIIQQLINAPNWSSGGDLSIFWGKVCHEHVRRQSDDNIDLEIRAEDLKKALDVMVNDKLNNERAKQFIGPSTSSVLQAQPLPFAASQLPNSFKTSTNAARDIGTSSAASSSSASEQSRPIAAPTDAATRDQGVSDRIWQTLLQDKLLQQRLEQERIAEQKRLEEERRRLEEKERQLRLRLEQGRLELEERKRIEEEQRRIAEEKARIEAEQRKLAEEREREVRRQQALQRMGVCVAGFQWIKQAGGYRCAGGSHFVSDSQLPS
jgi:Skp family chaperone for outer membrane proteins